jgi:hypothetical protein
MIEEHTPSGRSQFGQLVMRKIECQNYNKISIANIAYIYKCFFLIFKGILKSCRVIRHVIIKHKINQLENFEKVCVLM